MNYVVQSLKEGKMVVEICEAYTITGSGSGHFIVLTGVTRDGYITIADCASRERTGKVYSVETIKSYGRDLSEGAFWIVGKNEGNTVKKIRSTEQILVLAILLFTYFLKPSKWHMHKRQRTCRRLFPGRMAKVISQMGHLLLMAGV